MITSSLPNKPVLAQAGSKDSVFDDLIASAEENGRVSVIVGLDSGFVPEGSLADGQRVDQRERLDLAKDDVLHRLTAFQPENFKRLGPIPYFAASLDAAALRSLRESPEITYIRRQIRLEPTLAESTAVIGAPVAWQRGFTGSEAAVAILDTGVEKTHPFLAGKIISEACYSTTSASENTADICPPGSPTAPGSGIPCSFGSGCDHGTHVAGIAAGRLPSGSLQGVARGADVVSIQVFSRNTVTNRPDAFDSDITSGLARVLELKQSGMNIAAANMSLGDRSRNLSYCDDFLPDVKAAIDNLRSVGVATVISSGNTAFSDGIGFPGCISSAVSVGSTEDSTPGLSTDSVSTFSNSASILDLLAPGSLINSSVPSGTYRNMVGTSMAAPHVSGAFAVLRQRDPAASVSDLLGYLKASGRSITDARNGIAKPRIDLGKAVCYSTAIAGQSLNGQLAITDCSLTSGAKFDAYAFNGTAGQRVAITLNAGFDGSLTLLDPKGQILVENDNGGGGTNARIPATSGFFILPETGIYSIYATSPVLNATGSYTLRVDAAPLVSVSGRVVTPSGLGLRNAIVTLTDRAGVKRQATTSSFGIYSFENVAVSEAYVMAVNSKRYRFAPKNVVVNESLSNVDFIGLE